LTVGPASPKSGDPPIAPMKPVAKAVTTAPNAVPITTANREVDDVPAQDELTEPLEHRPLFAAPSGYPLARPRP
jgi:hypothetical protein